MRYFAALVCLCLPGCLSPATYRPYVTDITNPSQLTTDEAFCRVVAQSYRTKPDAGAILAQATEGALHEAPAAAIGPEAPILGAVGSGGSEFLAEIGVMSDKQIRIFLRCLDHRGQKSGAYSVVDPGF